MAGHFDGKNVTPLAESDCNIPSDHNRPERPDKENIITFFHVLEWTLPNVTISI